MRFVRIVGGLIRQQGIHRGGERFDTHNPGKNRAIADAVFNQERRTLIDLERIELRGRFFTRAATAGDFARASSLALFSFAALTATPTATSQRPTFFPSRSPAWARARRTRSSVTPKSFAASATRFGTSHCFIPGSNQPAFNMNGERTIVPLRR